MNEHIIWLLEVFGAVITVGAAAAVIWKIIKPFKQALEKIAEHEKRLNSGEERFEEISQAGKMQCRCLLVLIDHEITGNSVENLKSMKRELQNFLVDNSQ